MEAICAVLAAHHARRKTAPDYRGCCWTLCPAEMQDYRLAMQELQRLGWVPLEREEPHPLRIRYWPDRTYRPWYRDPVTGTEIKGSFNAMAIALTRYLDELCPAGGPHQ